MVGENTKSDKLRCRKIDAVLVRKCLSTFASLTLLLYELLRNKVMSKWIVSVRKRSNIYIAGKYKTPGTFVPGVLCREILFN
jgi:hypothetical protein